jgi:hypothetical protein
MLSKLTVPASNPKQSHVPPAGQMLPHEPPPERKNFDEGDTIYLLEAGKRQFCDKPSWLHGYCTYFVYVVLELEPWKCPRGQTTEVWNRVAAQIAPFLPTGLATGTKCHARFDYIVKKFKQGNARLRGGSGLNEAASRVGSLAAECVQLETDHVAESAVSIEVPLLSSQVFLCIYCYYYFVEGEIGKGRRSWCTCSCFYPFASRCSQPYEGQVVWHWQVRDGGGCK